MTKQNLVAVSSRAAADLSFAFFVSKARLSLRAERIVELTPGLSLPGRFLILVNETGETRTLRGREGVIFFQICSETNEVKCVEVLGAKSSIFEASPVKFSSMVFGLG